jgi:branched-chain amino acid transport system ATP-binding protein
VTRPGTAAAAARGPVSGPGRPLLQAHDLVRSFGGFRAVDGVSLEVSEGSIHAVIGPNGAGKTTLFRLLTGILRPTSGRLLLDGDDVTAKPPHVIARRGLAQSFQMTTIFPRLTALESVQAAILARRRRSGSMISWFHKPTAEEAMQVLTRVGLAERAGAGPGPSPTGISVLSMWPSPSPPAPGCCCWTSPPRACRQRRPARSSA